ncbi:hypothetical protein [Phenylobacterium aquaticum]|uniref:SHOCT-like domain-containing protein n=1 Tax=Phenylobacterium aquaticum TaxID=1763816 RepID=UPI0026EF4721|nr:hypothetical protein [Phenylobacterium aquaticum]
MSEDRRTILNMLSQGKITPEEAERLLAAVDAGPARIDPPADTPKAKPKYLRVAVDTDEHGKPTRVNVRVPMQLLRAGVRLSSIIPPEARERVNEAMRRKGHASFDLNSLKPENLEELIEQLNDLTVDVDQERTKVRIYCE